MQYTKNPSTTLVNSNYGTVAKFFHWTIAILILTNYLVGLTLDQSGRFNLHKQVGLTILFLVILRILWRLVAKYPGMVIELSMAEKFLARLGHTLLYILMLAIPLSGVLMVEAHGFPLYYLGAIHIPVVIGVHSHAYTHTINQFHKWMAHAIIALAALHGLTALKHHFINKDSVLSRMLPKSHEK